MGQELVGLDASHSPDLLSLLEKLAGLGLCCNPKLLGLAHQLLGALGGTFSGVGDDPGSLGDRQLDELLSFGNEVLEFFPCLHGGMTVSCHTLLSAHHRTILQWCYRHPEPSLTVGYFFRSPRICWEANRPGAPMTQPPGWVPDPHW